MSLITKRLAKSLGLKGKKVTLSYETISSEKRIETVEYCVSVVDNSGTLVELYVIEVDRISSQVNCLDKSFAENFFSAYSQQISYPLQGEIDILVGMQYAAYQPVIIDSREQLVLLRNRFGLIMAGSYSGFKPATILNQSVMHIRHGVIMHTTGTIERNFEIEGLGVSCNPKCGSCKCGRCHPGGKDMSLEEEKELEIIESNIEFNTSTGRFCSSLPWTENRKYLEFNESMAYAVMKSTERQLQKKGDQFKEIYSAQITDMLNRKAAREVTEEELRNYHGQKYFVTHLAVPKPDSKSTPYRLVFNSSALYKGHSINSSLLKGPTVFNAILGVLLRFRQHPYAYAGDLSKMYHSIDIPIDDQMMHLFLWRFYKNVKPTVFAITALNMGDKPSSAIAQVCLRKAAEASSLEHPEAAKIITDNSYMDDILVSSQTLAESESITDTIASILKKKGFHIKEWVRNDNTGNAAHVNVNMRMPDRALEAENALGMKWVVENDRLRFKVILTIENLVDNPVTRCNIIKILNHIFNPMGLLAPFIVKCKIVLRDVYATSPGLGWDHPVPEFLETEWKKILLEIPGITNFKLGSNAFE